MPTITIVDAIMGAGKTTWAHAAMRKHYAKTWEDHSDSSDDQCADGQRSSRKRPRVIYVTPFLEEVERAKAACPELDLREPESIDGRPKWMHFEALLRAGENIATTHALLPFLSEEGIQAIRDHGYHLIVDEALEGIDLRRTLTTKEIEHLRREEWIKVDETTGAVTWLYGDHTGHRFEDVQRLAKTGSLFLVDGNFLIWEFPQKALDAFAVISVLTYLFEGSTLCAYLRANDYPYQVLGIDHQGQIKPRDDITEFWVKETIRDRLVIYEGPRNAIGSLLTKGRDKTPTEKFTVSHLKGVKPDAMKRITNTVRTFIERDARVSSQFVGWTTFKEFREGLTGRGYASSDAFIPVNARASNNWRDRKAMIYLANRFPNPVLTRYIEKKKGQVFDDDLFALSEMLQWLWRGCIRDRDGGKMIVFVPSQRMRALLKAWLETDTLPQLREALAKLKRRMWTAASTPSL